MLRNTAFILSAIFLVSCTDSDTPAPTFDGAWSIPRESVFSGGPGVDGIPALQNPQMINASEATYLQAADLVIGFKIGDDVRAYPHRILDWHEIINDDLNDKSIAITYCPLTGTAIGWNRVLDGVKTTFGVSGLLYNTNLIPYDRNTQSAWSQMLIESVNGDLIGSRAETYTVVETTWATWKTMYPQSKVVSRNTGIDRNYSSFPYFINGQDYRTDPFLLFPVDVSDNRLSRKERVLSVIIQGEAKAYRISEMGDQVRAILDNFMGTDLVIAGSNASNFSVAFNRRLADGTVLEFTALQNQLPMILQDNEGNIWDVFGKAVSGPRAGESLVQVTNFMGYWFAFGTFYPGLELNES